MTFREAVPLQNTSWREEGLKLIRGSAAMARSVANGLTKPTAYRSLIETLAIAYEEAALAFDAAWEREERCRPELRSGLDADVGRAGTEVLTASSLAGLVQVRAEAMRQAVRFFGSMPVAARPSFTETVAAFLTILCDLTIPASLDALARIVAEHIGIECVSTAPSFYWMPGQRGSRDCDGAPDGDDWPPGWWLSNESGDLRFFTGADWCPDDHTMVPGLPDGMGHAREALTMIALQVLARPKASR